VSGLRIGVFLPSMSKSGGVPGDIAATARHAEGLGLDSVWVVDQLIAATGAPLLDSGIALATAAAVTSRVQLGFGVMILPLRPVAWVAKIVASLQHTSGDRVILGVGVGGDRHQQSWAAVGVPRSERGRRTDAALRALPGLLAGEPTRVGEGPGAPIVKLSPPAALPPILVGGVSDAAMARAVEYGDGWFSLPFAPDALAHHKARLTKLAAARKRPAPGITATAGIAFWDDPALPDQDSLTRLLTDVNGPYGIPAGQVTQVLVSGSPAKIAARLDALAAAGADSVVVDFPAGHWQRQADLLAQARDLLR
jgi:alkanesulfonate monooxygenase SsuD/methylene tetrahydromethanopterin reductase-like flavin-dependent oxidoreductase (luciferase family)